MVTSRKCALPPASPALQAVKRISRPAAASLAAVVFMYAGCTVPRRPAASPEKTAAAKSDTTTAKKSPDDTLSVTERPDTLRGLSAASELLVRACDNYLSVNPENPKAVDVLTIKASLFFNNRYYDSARSVYKRIINGFPSGPSGFDAIRMVAQTYYEQRNYDQAQTWFKKLSEAVPEGFDKTEAIARIAESIFRMAEAFESEGRFKDAAEQYERVALEYPDARIADVSLFNAGLAYEKQAEWSHAILVFQRLQTKYRESKLWPKTQFRIAKCHEKLLKWDLAAETYLRIAAKYPDHELAPAALYNAGFSFENGEKWREAAATFEKTVQLFPASEDAADVLFRAGELYGKIKDWESVGRVTKLFSGRFGNDETRIVQALCMAGVALYMRNLNEEAIGQLNSAVSTFARMKNPGPMNAYYAAKALYTIAEIHHTAMNGVMLGRPRDRYRKQLAEKSSLLDKAIDSYVKVIKFNISEWTTRSMYHIGQAYEDFAVGIFSQDRPPGLGLDERIAFELGLAKAVDEYFVEKAVQFHERNVKLGIKEKIEDRFVLQSRKKLTYLPATAAENYLALVEIAHSSREKEKGEGFGLIARTLQTLQKIAPFQERAIALFLRCLELGETYREHNEHFRKASESITGISFSVGKTYADVVGIAREAPIPGGFDDYERFVYKSKLLKQIEGYENQALDNYLKTIKIAEAYRIDDLSVKDARAKIAELLFNRGRCYDLLCIDAFSRPPFPRDIDEAEKEEYKARFEEIGLRFQEQAFSIYRNVLEFARQSYASGDYVTHAYIRLYQNYPEEFGSKEQRTIQTMIGPGSQWRVSADSAPQWFMPQFDDSAWSGAQRAPLSTKKIGGFPGSAPIPMWFGSGDPAHPSSYRPFPVCHFRRTFALKEPPHAATLLVAAEGVLDIYLNGEHCATDTTVGFPVEAYSFDMMGKIRTGINTVGLRVRTPPGTTPGLFPLVVLKIGASVPLPKPPGFESPLSPDEARVDTYRFPALKNFSVPVQEATR